MAETELGWNVFQSINPSHAVALSFYDTQADVLLEKRTTLSNEETLFDARSSKPYYLHSPDGALLEAKAWVRSFLQGVEEKTEVLVLYGLGLGWYWKALLPWLERKNEREIFIIEDDLPIIAHCIESSLGNALFSHPKTHVIALSGTEDKENIDLISWGLFSKKFVFAAIPPYLANRANAVRMIEHVIQIRSLDLHLVASEFSTFGVQHARNWLHNLLFIKEGYNAQDLFQKWRGRPIIVAAAGPSLKEAIPFLKKHQDTVLIIAGGSAINGLIEAGITPHLCVTVDPNPLQYNRMKYLEPFHLPLIFRSRALYEGVAASGGAPLLYLKGGDGYPFISYCEEFLGITGPVLDGGDSISTLLIELAVSLGASSIIMIGYDLGYLDGKRYTDSMQGLLHESEETLHINSYSGITALSNNGTMIQTEGKWIIEGKWISSFVEGLDQSIQIINTSLNGLKIEGVPVLPLIEAEQKFLATPQKEIFTDLFTALYSCERLESRASDEAIAAMLQKMSIELESFQELAKKVLSQLQDEYQKELYEFSQEIESQIDELESSFAYKNLLKPFWQMHLVWHRAKIHLYTPYYTNSWRETQKKSEKESLIHRLTFILDATNTYQSLFFSYVSWAILEGCTFSNPLAVAPCPSSVKERQVPDL